MPSTYCHECSSTNKRLSSFICDHCQLSMCYECFTKHSTKLTDEYSLIQKRSAHLRNVFLNKKQLLNTFEEHCLRNVHSTFDEIIQDIENLRKESLHYVKEQFHQSEVSKTRFSIGINSFLLDHSLRYNQQSQTI